MKNNGILKNTVLVTVLVLMTGCLLVTPVSAKTFNLSFATATPDMHPITENMLKPWAKKVEEVTDGQVKITMHLGGTLAKGDSMLEAVGTGLADIGWVSNAYFPNQLPLLNSLAVPGYTFNTSKVAAYVDRDFIDKYPQAILDDLEYMFVFSPAPGILLTRQPIDSLEDLKGMQIRCDGVATKGVSALGATPVAMPMAEAYEALSKSVIDGVVGPAEPLIGWNLAEVLDYIIEVPFMYNAFPTVIMNKDTWNSLPADVQDAIREVNEEHFKDIAGLFDEIYLEAFKVGFKNDIQVIELPDEEMSRWKAKMQHLKDNYAEMLNEKGLPGTEAMQVIQELTDKYNKEFADYNKEMEQRKRELIEGHRYEE